MGGDCGEWLAHDEPKASMTLEAAPACAKKWSASWTYSKVDKILISLRSRIHGLVEKGVNLDDSGAMMLHDRRC